MLVFASGRTFNPFSPFPHCSCKGNLFPEENNESSARLLRASAPELERYRPPEYATITRRWWYDQGFGLGLVLFEMGDAEEAYANAKYLDETVAKHDVIANQHGIPSAIPDTFQFGISDSLGFPLPRPSCTAVSKKHIWHGEEL